MLLMLYQPSDPPIQLPPLETETAVPERVEEYLQSHCPTEALVINRLSDYIYEGESPRRVHFVLDISDGAWFTRDFFAPYSECSHQNLWPPLTRLSKVIHLLNI